MTHPVSTARLHRVLEEIVASRTDILGDLLGVVVNEDGGGHRRHSDEFVNV